MECKFYKKKNIWSKDHAGKRKTYSNSQETLKILETVLENICSKYPNHEVILAGDWNTKSDLLTRRIGNYIRSINLSVAIVREPKTYHRKGKAKSDIDHIVKSYGIPHLEMECTHLFYGWIVVRTVFRLKSYLREIILDADITDN